MSSQEANFITGDGRLVNIKDIADVYRDVYSLSTPKSGKIQRLSENNYSLSCRFHAVDCDVLETVKTTKAYSLTIATRKNQSEKYIDSVRCVTDPYALAEMAVATSENGRFLARIRGSANNSNGSDKKQLLEIWDRSKLLKTIDTSELEVHGAINTDSQFSSFHWCQFGNQDKLLYVCNKKSPKYQSFFKQTKITTGGEAAAGDDGPKGKRPNLGDEFTRQEDWGECLKGIEHTVVAMLDAANDCSISILDMEGFSLGDARCLQGMKTISVAYQEEPKRLGTIYCNNRPSKLVVHDWTESPAKKVLELNSDTHCFFSPRVSHSGKKFIYMATRLYGPHKRPSRLHLYDLETGEDCELVDKKTQEVEHFIFELSDNSFSTNDRHILFANHDHLHHQMCLFCLETSTLTKIKFPTTGLDLLDFRHDIILATGSELNATPTLFVTVLNPVDPGELVAWHQLEDCLHLDEIDYDAYEIPTNDGSSFVSAILVTPTVSLLHKNFVTDPQQLETGKLASSEYDLPTVVLVHGGPHSTFLIDYQSTLVVYARLGLRTFLINYRGSTGVSDAYSKSLCGKVGQLDVEDCLLAIRHLVNNKVIDPEKLIIQGGSHGGFLSCHLSCQDEFKFTSAIIRNPVVDISTMHTTTDIPDWCYTEVLNHDKFDPGSMPNSQDLVKMFECSPIFKYREAKVPTLMLLGSQDYRVKMFQGERWFELLKARGVKAKCKVYADKHDLSKPESASDGVITAIMWILSNLRA